MDDKNRKTFTIELTDQERQSLAMSALKKADRLSRFSGLEDSVSRWREISEQLDPAVS